MKNEKKEIIQELLDAKKIAEKDMLDEFESSDIVDDNLKDDFNNNF